MKSPHAAKSAGSQHASCSMGIIQLWANQPGYLHTCHSVFATSVSSVRGTSWEPMEQGADPGPAGPLKQQLGSSSIARLIFVFLTSKMGSITELSSQALERI